jgi:hypothetical protein
LHIATRICDWANIAPYFRFAARHELRLERLAVELADSDNNGTEHSFIPARIAEKDCIMGGWYIAPHMLYSESFSA